MQTYSGNIIDVIAQRIFKGEITVENGKITSVIEKEDVSNCYIAPGLIDAHIHIESSMLIPSDFAREAVKHGTVATVSDPHEIANVLGIEGVKFMIQNAQKTPFKFFFGAPSCVPATGFETSGGIIGIQETKELLAMPEISYLSEMMNYPGVVYNDPIVMQKIALAKQYGKPIDGHAPALSGDNLQKYASAGISTDHECMTLDEALEKIALGMTIQIREGSAAKNFDSLFPLIKQYPDKVMFCSDDKHPQDLLQGHINLLIRRALQKGCDLLTILRACTYNPVKHYHLKVGLLQQGDDADFIIFDNPQDFNIQKTFIKGELIGENGKSYIPFINEKPVNNFNTQKICPEDLAVRAETAKIKVIEIIPGELMTHAGTYPAKIKDNKVVSDLENDILKMMVLNRYQTAKPAIAFIKNIGLKQGAFASTIAHDCHNIICVGTNDDDMVSAVNALIDCKGGISVSLQNKAEILPLPFAGLMANEDAYTLAKQYQQLEAQVKNMGSVLQSPFMTLSFMALLVIPQLKLSDKGLFDGAAFTYTSLFVK